MEQNFIPTAGGAFGIAVDGQHIYWANNMQGSTIGRADLDGGNVDNSFIPGATDPEGVAVDGSHIYWGNYGAGMIGRANLNGSGPQQNFVTGADGPTGIALDGQHIFWSNTNGNTVGRVDLDGISNKDPNFIPDPLALNTEGVAVFGGFIYWTTTRRGHDRPGQPRRLQSEPRLHHDGCPVAVRCRGRRGPAGVRGGGGKSLKFGKVKLNKKKGTALLPVTVPSAGTLSLGGKGLVHKRLGQAPALGKLFKKVPKAGTYTLKVKAKGKKKAKLFSTGKVKVKAVITFKPTSGEAVHATHKIKLKKN